MDWNHDGKFDWKDDAFYHNVVEPGIEKDRRASQVSSNKNNNSIPSTSSADSKGAGWIIFIILCVLCLIGGLLGD